MDKIQLTERMDKACHWIADIAQVKTEMLDGNFRLRLHHSNWKGSVAEYDASQKQWYYYCAIWHTGQALKSLCRVYPVLKDARLLGAARLAAEFIVRNQVADRNDPDYGLIFAYEDDPHRVNISAVLECLDGLFHFSGLTGEKQWRDCAVNAALWVKHKAYIAGQGIFRDCYDPQERAFVTRCYGTEGRPLLDDGIFYQVYKITGDVACKQVFFEVAERLLMEEDPPGNWINYVPCNKDTGAIHPRHAYWWGYPMRYAYAETKDTRYLDCLVRSGDWYAKAQRRDGGLFRNTYRDFTSDSLGHAASGMGCALIMWQSIEKITGQSRYRENIELGLQFLLNMQLTNPSNPNLKGAIIEKMHRPPEGTDVLPYLIRDLGTIFFVQAVADYLQAG